MSLEVDNLRVYYRTLHGDVRALDGATFEVADGEIMGLAGESGCGKTTLGKSLIRLDGRMRLIGGTVALDGVELPIGDTQGDERVPLPRGLDHPAVRDERAQPDPQDRADDLRAARLARGELRRDAAGAGAPARARRAGRRGPRPLPDRALRRSEAARRDGALDAARPVAPDRGRAHVRARRVDAAGGRRDARRVPRPRVREEHDRDHARPVDPLPDRRHDPRHVRGQARREGLGGRGHRGSAASLHASCCSARCPRSACATRSSG